MAEFICHCTVNAFDGVTTISARPTEFVEAQCEQEAIQKAKEQLGKTYEGYGCSVNWISVALVRKI
jgi:hypothetical protein